MPQSPSESQAGHALLGVLGLAEATQVMSCASLQDHISITSQDNFASLRVHVQKDTKAQMEPALHAGSQTAPMPRTLPES